MEKIFRRYKNNIILTNNNIDLKQLFEDKFSYNIFYTIPTCRNIKQKNIKRYVVFENYIWEVR